MKKKRNKFIIIIVLVFCCIIGAYTAYPYVYTEKGTLYTVSMNKYCKNLNFDFILLGKYKNNMKNPKYVNCKEESKKILDYINKFEIKKISSKEAHKNEKIQDEIRYITFSGGEMNGNDPEVQLELKIRFLSDSILEISSFGENILTLKDHEITKCYKITDGNIDFKYINKILSNTEKI